MKHERIHATRVEHLDTRGLYGLDADAWDSLSVNALVENPFYARQVVLAGLDTIDRRDPIEALAVRGPGDELLGLFPFRRRRGLVEMADAACNLYQYSTMPLIRRDQANAVIATWLDGLRTIGSVPRTWRFKHLHLESRMVALLDGALAERSMRREAVTMYRRPHLTRVTGGFEGHIAEILPKRRRKDIARRIRRLREIGDLRFERARDPALVAERLEQFLELEHAGWKGTRGTAFLAKCEDAAFARAAFTPRQGGGCSVTTDSLLLDGCPLAININLQANQRAFTPKGAYDERYRRYSPGLALEYLAVRAFYEDQTMTDMDATTTEEDHVVSDLWNGSKSMGVLLLGPASWQLHAMARCEKLVHVSRKFAKATLQYGAWGRRDRGF